MYTHNLGQKFKQISREFASATAILSEAGKLTYEELDQRSDAVASYLKETGLRSGDVVCISGKKSIQSIIVIISCIKIGVIYSVFDPESPVARLVKIFERCEPRLVVCEVELAEALKFCGFNTHCINELEVELPLGISNQLIEDLNLITSDSPAYIMFTSGSTGFPKGAVITHGNVLNLISWSQQCYGFTTEDVLTSINPLFFDNSVFDVYSSLFTGASLALFDNQIIRNPQKLLALIDQYKCTSWFSVPSMLIYLQTMRAFNKNSLQTVKRIIFGGEGYPKAKLKQLFDIFQHRIAFHNVYGPTECTCICSSYHVAVNDFIDLKGFLPIGQLAPNFFGIIVDQNLSPVQSGESGELVLKGPNVGYGYYRDGERTDTSFIQNPLHSAYRDIVYRTGDVVFRSLEDDKIWICGRQDNQIKHMGYRIELEEIENALNCVEGIEIAAVIHNEKLGLSQLIAYVSSKDRLNEQIVRIELTKILPEYMIPTKFFFLDQLPKNANGKLDRKQLKLRYEEQLTNG